PWSDPEVDHAVHDEITDAHPTPCKGESDSRQVLIPDACVEAGNEKLNDGEHADRQSRKNQCGSAAFGSERTNLATHLEAFTDDRRKIFENFAQVAAGRSLNRDRGNEQRQIIRTHAEIQIT